MDQPLVNRIANSKLKVINLEDYFPKSEVQSFDVKDYLFHGLILKEKDFRAALKELDWSVYESQSVAIHCSADAIVPTWAYMLVSSYLEPLNATHYFCDPSQFLSLYYTDILSGMDLSIYAEERVVIKGCSTKPVPTSAYVELTKRLRPHAQSVMYGEPCSTVPVFKRPRKV